MVVSLTTELVKEIRGQCRIDAIRSIHLGMIERCGIRIELRVVQKIVDKMQSATEEDLRNMRINNLIIFEV